MVILALTVGMSRCMGTTIACACFQARSLLMARDKEQRTVLHHVSRSGHVAGWQEAVRVFKKYGLLEEVTQLETIILTVAPPGDLIAVFALEACRVSPYARHFNLDYFLFLHLWMA